MIVAKALRLAGEGAVLASRPAGVRHVYVGPLTPSGRFVPRSGQTVCRAHTRRLQVLEASTSASIDLTPDGGGLCARCSACLLRALPRWSGQAGTLESRAAFLLVHRETTKADVAFALAIATTPTEVDHAAHLSLVLFDVAGCSVPFAARGRTWRPLHQLVVEARTRVGGSSEITQHQRDRRTRNAELARLDRIARRQEVVDERERRIDAVGFDLANPRRPKSKANRRSTK